MDDKNDRNVKKKAKTIINDVADEVILQSQLVEKYSQAFRMATALIWKAVYLHTYNMDDF